MTESFPQLASLLASPPLCAVECVPVPFVLGFFYTPCQIVYSCTQIFDTGSSRNHTFVLADEGFKELRGSCHRGKVYAVWVWYSTTDTP